MTATSCGEERVHASTALSRPSRESDVPRPSIDCKNHLHLSHPGREAGNFAGTNCDGVDLPRDPGEILLIRRALLTAGLLAFLHPGRAHGGEPAPPFSVRTFEGKVVR